MHQSLRPALAGLCLVLFAGCGGDSTDEQVELGPQGEPTIEEAGERLAKHEGVSFDGLSDAERAVVARGSYLINGASLCGACHTREAGHLAGGREFPLPPPVFPFSPDSQGFTSIFSRNLTPDPETGLQLTEAEFIEAMRTGRDFTDSTPTSPQAMFIMPWHLFRWISDDDLRAMYAYLRRIPPIRNEIRKTFMFPGPPVPFPAVGGGDVADQPDNSARGLSLLTVFSSGQDHSDFLNQFNAALSTRTPAEQARIGRGSYLVNTLGGCNDCHTPPFGGVKPNSVDINVSAYLSGGVDIGTFEGIGPVFSRNLTPHPTTGLALTQDQFISTLRFGADFRRPGGSLRVAPHFPAEFRHTLGDLQAIDAYLRTIPPVDNAVTIVP